MKKTLLALAAGFALTACGGTAESSNGVSREEAQGQAEGALLALDAGDYAQFSRDFSPTLLEALPEKNFAELRHRLEETSGHFQSVESLSEVSDPGYATFEMTASFEREPVRVLTWYPIGSHEMQGFWMDSENLQAFHSDD
ncbi:MAG: DUF3887 domain-containing protein [Myxococcales bacterium]|nr:DUF3887 domain-containing protein [Myxococcales bacterium]MCB9581911.1 DUF3887 domain-containing protein [Polyangiaceae bacterium]